jgi:hypothetical protein
MNHELKTKKIDIDTFLLTGKIDNKDIINNLIYFIKNNINKELSYKTHVKGKFTGFESLNENIYFLMFLKLIKKEIYVIYKKNFVIGNVWGNVLKINEEITNHTHGGVTAFCGILYLSENGPGTYFKDYDVTVEEQIGKYILFSPVLNHSVKKIDNDIERITVAFNMYELKEWEDKQKIQWVNR